MKYAKYVYTVAGVYGILVIAPIFLMEQQMNVAFPPAITHPEQFYGFLVAVLAWQFAFLLIGRDPVRYRPLMLPTLIEKFGYVIAVAILYAQGRIPTMLLGFVFVDLVLGVLFVMAYQKVPATYSPADTLDQARGMGGHPQPMS